MKEILNKAASSTEWNDWKWQLNNRIKTSEELAKYIHLTPQEKKSIELLINNNLPMVVTPYFASLLDKNNPDCPIRKQIIPNIEELSFTKYELNDPCGEESDSPVPCLFHRYPDRVLLIATEECAVYCRYCTRKRFDRREGKLKKEDSINLQQAYQYIREHKNIRDVILSGGDPLLLETEKLEKIIKNLRKIPHVEIIRIGTRVPSVLPQRIDKDLVKMLKKYHPIFMSVHFTHYREITPEVKEKCIYLADNGIPLGSQTVLLNNLNDSSYSLKKLFHELLKIRVKPYYLYQCDLALGTDHFRTPVEKGIKIIEDLRGHTSGYAIPTFVIDAPTGGGKIPIGPNYVISNNNGKLMLRNYQMRVFQYPENTTLDKTVPSSKNSSTKKSSA